MSNNNLTRRIVRKFSYPLFRTLIHTNWSFLRYYPAIIPDQDILDRWQQSEWNDYAEWVARNSIITREQWLEQHKIAKQNLGRTKISIVTPVYNTETAILKECILSVRTQTSPYWELILVDDGSDKPGTLEVLRSPLCIDPRIRLIFKEKGDLTGISAATNKGIEQARGDYIAFLDHDDRLAPEAVQKLISAIESDPDVDILYSDRDMLSLGGKRFMHLMKPDWSPDNLYAGNYIFHLMCYKLDLIQKVGKLRSEYDGSQDYDLILRCMELDPKVTHLPYVLYHWRQSETSVSLEDDAKGFAFEAGMAALHDALKRRGINGKVTENKKLWRGNYEVELPLPPKEDIGIISLPAKLSEPEYVEAVMNNDILQDLPPFIFIHQNGRIAEHDDTVRILASWLELEQIGMVSGCLTNKSRRIVNAGMVYTKDGHITAPYSGYDFSEPGYMAATKAVRNISVPDPFSVMINRELWQSLDGLSRDFKTTYGLLDFAFSAIENNWRILFVPKSIFISSSHAPNIVYPLMPEKIFIEKWQKHIANGDPFYSRNLKIHSNRYELA